MSERTDHPPSTDDQTATRTGSPVRRAIIGGAAGPRPPRRARGPGHGRPPRRQRRSVGPPKRLGDVTHQRSATRRFACNPTSDHALGLRRITTTTTAPPTTTTTAPAHDDHEPLRPPRPSRRRPSRLRPPRSLPRPTAAAALAIPTATPRGTHWRSASRAATGTSTPATVTTAACSSRLGSWQAVGGTGYPHENSRETQIHLGQGLYASLGLGSVARLHRLARLALTDRRRSHQPIWGRRRRRRWGCAAFGRVRPQMAAARRSRRAGPAADEHAGLLADPHPSAAGGEAAVDGLDHAATLLVAGALHRRRRREERQHVVGIACSRGSRRSGATRRRRSIGAAWARPPRPERSPTVAAQGSPKTSGGSRRARQVSRRPRAPPSATPPGRSTRAISATASRGSGTW